MALKDIELTCAIAKSTYLLGDHWSLLILRDMLLHHKTRFKEFLNSKEKIATNILTNRLKTLTDKGLIILLNPNSTKKSRQYIATEKGVSRIPTANSAHININIRTNIPMYKRRFFTLFVRLLIKLIPILSKKSREPIIMKSNGLQLISLVIDIPINGINNRERG